MKPNWCEIKLFNWKINFLSEMLFAISVVTGPCDVDSVCPLPLGTRWCGAANFCLQIGDVLQAADIKGYAHRFDVQLLQWGIIIWI